MQYRALILSDNANLVKSMVFALPEADFELAIARDAVEAVKKVYDWHPDIVVMEEQVSCGPDFDLCDHIGRISSVSTIVLGEANDDISVVEVLQRGADFYTGKPYAIPELVARMKALLRRSGGWPRSMDRFLDVDTQSARVGDRWVGLTPAEFRLISYMALNRGRIVPAEEFTHPVWGGSQQTRGTSLSYHICQLRQKLDHSAPHNIFTHHGVGYRLAPSRWGDGDVAVSSEDESIIGGIN